MILQEKTKTILFYFILGAVSELTFWWGGDKRVGIGERKLAVCLSVIKMADRYTIAIDLWIMCVVGHSNGYDISNRRSGLYFLGTNLVHELRNRGQKVIALDRGNTEREEYMRADVRNYRQL